MTQTKKPPKPKGKKLRDKIGRAVADNWPDVDAEITFSESGDTTQILLRSASLKYAEAHLPEAIRKTRQMAAWVEKELGRLTGVKPCLRLCPRPRPFSDHRAPRLSHYEGTTWIFEIPTS